jgi:phosphoglycolate phosphatase
VSLVIKTLLLDFDYTLVDSSEGIVHCTQYAFAKMGRKAPSHDRICSVIGHSLSGQYVVLSGDHNLENAALFEQHFKEEQPRSMTQKTRLFPDTKRFLAQIAELDVGMAIVSTKLSETIVEFLTEHDLLHYFKAIIGEHEVKRLKPSPEGILLVMKQLHADPSTTVMVGDSIFDASAAENASIGFIGVLTGKTSRADFANFANIGCVHSLREAFHLLQPHPEIV